jgi:hypothetical protein
MAEFPEDIERANALDMRPVQGPTVGSLQREVDELRARLTKLENKAYLHLALHTRLGGSR